MEVSREHETHLYAASVERMVLRKDYQEGKKDLWFIAFGSAFMCV